MLKQAFYLLLLFPLLSFAQKSMPKVIKTAFEQQYASATKVHWAKEGTSYEVSFTQGTEKFSVVYDAKGNVIEVEKHIKASELPEAVKAVLKGKKINEAAEITKNGKTYYEAEVKGKDLFFDANGKPAKL